MSRDLIKEASALADEFRDYAKYVSENRDGWFATAPAGLEKEERRKAGIIDALIEELKEARARNRQADQTIQIAADAMDYADSTIERALGTDQGRIAPEWDQLYRRFAAARQELDQL